MISQMLGQVGLEDTNTADLSKRLEKVDLAAGDAKDVMTAVGSYLKESAGMAAEQVEQVVEQGQTVLASVLPSLGIVPKDTNGVFEEAAHSNGEVEANREKKSKTVVIEDVKAFKASMPLSAGVRAVKDLSEFEELGAKL
jgi:insulysin